MTHYHRDTASSIVLLAAIATAALINGIESVDVEVLVNESASIGCFPNEPIEIQWKHIPALAADRTKENYVYAGGSFKAPYVGRFRQNESASGIYILIIPNAGPEDAGLYKCTEDTISARVFDLINLTVLDSSPVCTSNMKSYGFVGPNDCDLQQENMTFTCAVSFVGNSRPRLTWRSLNISQPLSNPVCEYQLRRTICILTLRADPQFDDSIFICETTAISPRYNCNSEVIKIQYFSANYNSSERIIHGNISCEVNSNLDVRYNWTLRKNGETIPLSTDRTIVTKDQGIHRCEVEYKIANDTCSAPVSEVNITIISAGVGATTKDSRIISVSKEPSTRLLMIIIPIVIAIAVAVIIVIIIITFRLKSRKPKNGNNVEQGNRIPAQDNENGQRHEERFPLLEINHQPNNGPDNENDENNIHPAEHEPDPVPADNEVDAAVENENAVDNVQPGDHPGANLLDNDEERFKLKMLEQREKLQKLMESEFGLLDELITQKVLTHDEVAEIEVKDTPLNKNSLLLDIIFRKGKCNELAKALQKSDQNFVVKWIEENGVYKTDFRLNWPLEEKEVNILDGNRRQIIETLDANKDLLDKLRFNKVINHRQSECINLKADRFERSTSLFKMLRKSSLQGYYTTIKCLRESKQMDIAGLLVDGGVVLPVHVNLEEQETGKAVEELEEEIVTKCEQYCLIANKSFELVCDIVCTKLISLKKRNSILVYIYCCQTHEFEYLCTIVGIDNLKKSLEDLFGQLLKTTPTRVRSITINESDKENASRSFEVEKLRDKKFDEEFKKMHSQLLEESSSIPSPRSISPSQSKLQEPENSDEDNEKVSKEKFTTSITEKNWKQILQSNYADLLVGIDSNTGLEGAFRKLGLFSNLQIKSIWGQRSSIERNKAILSLLEKGDLKRFMAVRGALEDSFQQPVVEQHLTLIKDHSSKTDTRYNKPLKESYRYLLLIHWNELLETINIDDLMFYLKERRTLTAYQLAVIEDMILSQNKTSYLLRLIETGSQQHFDDLCACLRENNQPQIVTTYLTPKSVNTKLDEIKKSFKDVNIRISSSGKPKRGRMVIISNRYYMDQTRWIRSEMHQNLMNLDIVFQDKLIIQRKPLFDKNLIENKPAEELMARLEAEQKGMKDCDVFLMFIFSYGINGELFTVDGQSLQIDNIFAMFDDENCPALKGKPKIFIIQTFRLASDEDSTDDTRRLLEEPECNDQGDLSITFNLSDDMAVVYATSKGERKDGKEETGTLFVRCFLDVFCRKVHELDFEAMIKEVQELLAKTDQKITDTETVRQLSTFDCNFRNKFYFLS